MNKVFLSLAVLAAVMGMQKVYASDWDEFGKAMAVVEGLRVLSGGTVDVIGAVTGIDRVSFGVAVRMGGDQYRHHDRPRGHQERIWVPEYVQVREYVSGHYEFRHGLRVYVDGYYVTRTIAQGGHWEILYPDRDHGRGRHVR